MMQPIREEAFDALLREAAAWRLRQALAALPSEERLRAEYGPLHRLDRRVRRSVRALQKAQQRRVLNRTSRRKMRRIRGRRPAGGVGGGDAGGLGGTAAVGQGYPGGVDGAKHEHPL